ncbi:MAG: hypothetical protein AAFR79_08560 [Pseudomonadota bacterium]
MTDDEAHGLSTQVIVDTVSLLKASNIDSEWLVDNNKLGAYRHLSRLPMSEGFSAFPKELTKRFAGKAAAVGKTVRSDENLKAALRTWDQADLQSRTQVARDLSKIICKCYGISSIPVDIKDHFDDDPDQCGAYYSNPIYTDVSVMSIDKDYLSNASAGAIVAVLAHELFHGYQEERGKVFRQDPTRLDPDLRAYIASTEISDDYYADVEDIPNDDYLSLTHERGARAMERSVMLELTGILGANYEYDNDTDELSFATVLDEEHDLGNHLKEGTRLSSMDALTSPDGRTKLRVAVNKDTYEHQLAVTDRFGNCTRWLDVTFGSAATDDQRQDYGLAIAASGNLEVRRADSDEVAHMFGDLLPAGVSATRARLELDNAGAVQFSVGGDDGNTYSAQLD